jgi:hypothetical protein
MIYCCPDLDKLAHPKDGAIGLVTVIDRRGARFLLLYQKDWKVPVAETGVQIHLCPYCGTKLSDLIESDPANGPLLRIQKSIQS